MFKAGSSSYLARITEEPLNLNGVECDGLCDESGRRILIDFKTPVDRRLWVLLHELAHAHIFAHGLPIDSESVCDFCATMATMAIRDLTAAGGEESLKRLLPGESLGRETAKILLTSNRYCPTCNGTVAPGSIDCLPDGLGQLVLRVDCGHCGKAQEWTELATAGGLPSGVVVRKPRLIERSGAASLAKRPCDEPSRVVVPIYE